MRRTRQWLSALGLIAMMAFAQSTWAATCTAKTGGPYSWDSRSTWTGCNGKTPRDGDTVIIPNGSTVTLNVDTNQLASLTVQAGGVLQGDNRGGQNLVDLTWGPGSNLTNNGTITLTDNALQIAGNFVNNGSFAAGASQTQIAGNFVNNGSFTAGTSQTQFVGNATQTISGTNPITFADLDLSNPTAITLGTNVTVAGQLTAPQSLTSTCPIDYTLTSNSGATVQHTCPTAFSCTPPSNLPVGVTVTCQCDSFNRSTLNPSTIFGANWVVSTSDATGILPSIVNPGYLRLTNNTGNNAKAVTVPGIFPAAGNYISVEFKHYAYNGSGADGVAVTLSDYSVPAVPGAYGGSLGYAQETGIHDGFAGGWIGVGIDEYGNYQNTNEGRLGGPGFIPESVGIRGSGSGQSGYNWLGGTAGLNPIVDNRGSTTPAPGYLYQVIVDARNPAATAVAVNRDTTGTGTSYSQLIGTTNVFTTATGLGFTQAPVPASWQISFTGSTGGSTNIHEIGAVRICASNMAPPTGGTASGFNAIDSAYGTPPSVAVQNYLTGHLFTKLMGTPFKLNVAALNNNQIVTTYAASGTKTVTVKLVDNSDSLPGSPNYSASAANCTQSCTSTCTGKPAVTGGSQTLNFTSGNKGQQQTANFVLNSAYQKLVAIISDGTTTACSTDAFSVRPLSVSSVTSNATNTGTSGTPIFKAGSTPFSLAATIAGVAGYPNGYTGVLQINGTAVQPSSPATVAGALTGTFPAAVSGAPSSTASGTAFTYSEVGQFYLSGANYTASPAISPGVYDNTWTSIDSGSTQNDCNSTPVAAAYSNAIDANGKYGCYFGITANTGAYGRFVPDHFALSPGATLTTRSDLSCSPASTFTYMDEPMAMAFTLTAQNATNGTTQNYAGIFAKLDLTNPASFGFGAINNAVTKTPLTPRLSLVSSSGSWTAGVATGISGVLAVSSLTGPGTPRTGGPDGPFDALDLGIAPRDTDSVQLSPSALNLDVDNNGTMDHVAVGTTAVRFGRLRLTNAFGSEVLDLPIPLEAQYWNGTLFVTNGSDSCTLLNTGNIALGNYAKGLTPTNMGTGHINLGGAFVNGKGSLKLTKPSPAASGSVDVAVNLGLGLGSVDQSCPAWTTPAPTSNGATMAYLRGKWCGANYDRDPRARVTFGIYKNANDFIYMREMY